MRLSDRIKSAIVEAGRHSFGDVDIILFGSRVDDTKRGGDIDLAVDGGFTQEQFCKQKAQFLSDLLRGGLDLDIDLISLAQADALLRSEVLSNGVVLR